MNLLAKIESKLKSFAKRRSSRGPCQSTENSPQQQDKMLRLEQQRGQEDKEDSSIIHYTRKSDLLGTTRHQQGQQLGCPGGEWHR